MKGNDYRPKLSVIVPIYKAEKYLCRCVDSLLMQTFRDFEVLLVDDGSPDQSGVICDKYIRCDSRVRVFHKENGGVSSARNLGIDKARGDYLTFIDADDWIDVDCFEKSFYIINCNNLDILQYSYKKICEENGSVICVRDYECDSMEWRKFVKADHYIVCVWGNFIRSSIIEKHHLRFNENLRLAEDQLFIMKAMTFCSRIAQTKKVYYNYFQNSASATHNGCEEDIIKSSIALLEFGKSNSLFKPQIDRTIANFYVDLLILNKGCANSLDSIYYDANVKLNNLSLTSLRILCIFSFFNMRIASKVVLFYIDIINIIFRK